MTDRNLTVARPAEEFIGGIDVESGAFGQFLAALGVAPKIEHTAVVTSAKAGEETRAYIVQVHTVPGTDGTTRVYACTCPAFKYHELPYPEQIEDALGIGWDADYVLELYADGDWPEGEWHVANGLSTNGWGFVDGEVDTAMFDSDEREDDSADISTRVICIPECRHPDDVLDTDDLGVDLGHAAPETPLAGPREGDS